jgi:hypothetical protein
MFAAIGFRDSNVMIDDCQFLPWSLGGTSALVLTDSRFWLVNSHVRGKSEFAPGTSDATSAIYCHESELFIGPGNLLEGGTSSTGRRQPITDGATPVSQSCGAPCGWIVEPSVIHQDPAAQLVGPYPPFWVTPDVRPVPAIRTTVLGSTLNINHRGTPQGVTLLGAGPLLPIAWAGPEGLICLDPASAFLWIAPIPLSGDLLWAFPIPPGLPQGFWLGFQAVELSPAGQLGLTNLVTFGNW